MCLCSVGINRYYNDKNTRYNNVLHTRLSLPLQRVRPNDVSDKINNVMMMCSLCYLAEEKPLASCQPTS